MGSPAIAVDGLWEAYRRRNRFGWQRRGGVHWALQDITFDVAPGRALGVIGGNGSGKTTLLQVLAGVLRPTRGRVEVAGRRASLVELSAGFHRDLTGHENLRVGAVLLGLSRRELRRRYDDVIAFTGLDAASLDAPLSSYSAGMGLRLGFSLVLATEPDVLLVDEVLAVGDESFQRRCVDRVHELQRSGCAVVLVSHDLDLVRRHCDEVAVLDAGHLVHRGEAAGAVECYRQRRDAAVVPPPAEAQLFHGSWRAQAARRRRGVT